MFYELVYEQTLLFNLNSKKPKKKAIVVGAGIAGLASAIRLANRGFEVEVLEMQASYGGKMGQWESLGYRFDTGPSLFTMPDYVLELLQIDGKNNVPFKYLKLDTVCRYFWNDGVKLCAFSNREKLLKEFEKNLQEPRENLELFFKNSEEKYRITNHVFLEKSLHRLSTYFSWSTLKSFLQIGKVEVFKNMHQRNSQSFQNPKTAQFFDRYATYNGSDPYQAPATLNVIPHYEFGFGAFAPQMGIRSIADSLFSKAELLGVKFQFNYRVHEVLKSGDGYTVNADRNAEILVCNLDVASASKGPFAALLSPKKLNYEPSSSALIFYWGIKKKFPDLDAHNIFFSDDYRREFETLFKNGSIPEDPTIYINISSKYNPGDAPESGENWFVMVNAPHVEKQDWDRLIAKTRGVILQKLSRILGEDIESLIEVEERLSPIQIMHNTGSHKGALYGSSSNKVSSAFLRQANFSSKHRGLYFCGGSVHPGGGIPLCLLSAKIATNKIFSDYQIHS